MLVHPDKNMGNVKAEEAFKKLQNAYEVMFFFLLPTLVKKIKFFSSRICEDLHCEILVLFL